MKTEISYISPTRNQHSLKYGEGDGMRILGRYCIIICATFFVLCLQAVDSNGNVTVTTGKITITGAPPKPAVTYPPFTPVTVTTGTLTITGATPVPPPPKGPFTPVNVTTGTLTITGK
jgi:hypothetical protein